MNVQTQRQGASERTRRRFRTWGACVALLALPALLLTGCSDATKNKFLLAALTPIQQGAASIAQGIIQGVVAVSTPGPGEPGVPDTGTTGTTAKTAPQGTSGL
jgi:hypothetical protein